MENRQKIGWDTDLPGAGLLILHVDYSSSAWSNNTPNDDPSHQRMTWIPADNKYQYETYDGTKYYTEAGAANDPFPYGNVNAFGKTTTPAAKLFNANTDGTYYLDSSIENITQNSNGTVSFNFVGISNVATPTFSPSAGRYAEAQTVSISCETSGATIYYTLDGTTPTTSSSIYTTPLTISETTTVKALAVKDGDQSVVASAKYTIGASTSNPNTTTFRLVETTDDLEPGLRYIIACGSKNMAAGELSNSILSNVQVTVSDDVITITDNVAVFVLDQTDDGWTFQNEDTDQYLVSTAAKNVGYSTSAYDWTLSNGTVGVIMTAGDYGTMLYNNSSPRFTTYTSSPNAGMIQANLYVEDSSATPVVPDPYIVADETVTFSTTVGSTLTKTFEVLSDGLTVDITVTLTDANNVFSLGSTTISKSASELGTTGSVTFSPTVAGTYTGTITLMSAGADPVTISLSATATESGSSTGSSNEFVLISNASDFVEGDYIIVYNNGAMNTNIVNDRLQITTVEPVNDIITTDDAEIIWHIAPSGDYYTIYNAGVQKYAASTGAKNKAQLLADGSDDKSLWSVTTGATFNFTNKKNTDNGVNANLRRNGDYGFACYASTTGGALSLYKRSNASSSEKDDVTMSFSPESVEITMGETFTAPTLTTDPEGLTVTYSSSDTGVATVDATTGEVTLVAEGTVTITATFAGDASYNSGSASYEITVSAGDTPVPTDRFELVTDASTLEEGDDILIAYVNTDNDVVVVMGCQASNNRAATYDVTLNSDNTLTPGTEAQIITLREGSEGFLFDVGDGFLYASSSNRNLLQTTIEPDDNAMASIEIEENGDATIIFQGANTRKYLRYNPNNNNPIFSCYAEISSIRNLPQIYRRVPGAIPTVIIEDGSDSNSELIRDYVGETVNVVLNGRTLYKDGEWNTLCLPFDLDINGTILEDATVKLLDSSSYDNGTLVLNFLDDVLYLEAGRTYLVKWEDGENIVNPEFEDVFMTNETPMDFETDIVTLVGTYDRIEFPDEDRTLLIMGANSKLFYPDGTANTWVNACRGYFQLADGYACGEPVNGNGIKDFVLKFDGEEATGIIEVESNKGFTEEWYDISGRRLNGRPTHSGIYINNGKKIFIK